MTASRLHDQAEERHDAPPSSGASSFLRRFRDTPNDLVQLPDGSGRKRLCSALFVSDEVSVDDGDRASVAECAAREKGSGIAGIAKAQVADLGIAIKVDPEPSNPAHCLILVGDTKRGKKLARKLAHDARILHAIDGVVVLDGSAADAAIAAPTGQQPPA